MPETDNMTARLKRRLNEPCGYDSLSMSRGGRVTLRTNDEEKNANDKSERFRSTQRGGVYFSPDFAAETERGAEATCDMSCASGGYDAGGSTGGLFQYSEGGKPH